MSTSIFLIFSSFCKYSLLVSLLQPKEELFNLFKEKDLPQQIKKIIKKNKIFDLVQYANEKKVNDLIEFKGHLEQIDHFFKEGTILIKLSRLDLSWGRDVIEAMSFGCPVISTGYYDKFVKSDHTGVLLRDFHLNEAVEEILKLITDQEKLKKLSKNAQMTVKNICMSEQNLNKISKILKCGAMKK